MPQTELKSKRYSAFPDFISTKQHLASQLQHIKKYLNQRKEIKTKRIPFWTLTEPRTRQLAKETYVSLIYTTHWHRANSYIATRQSKQSCCKQKWFIRCWKVLSYIRSPKIRLKTALLQNWYNHHTTFLQPPYNLSQRFFVMCL